jgi:hypothetical protein
VLAGVGAAAVIEPLRQRWTNALTAIPVLGLVLIGLPGARPLQWCPVPSNPHMTDVNQIELTALMGLDNEGTYFPVTATRPTDSPLLADYAADRTPQRFDATIVPAGSAVETTYRPLGADIDINTPEAFEARYLVYQFPGWRVWIDGAQADTYPDPETGLLRFRIPAGQHKIKIRFRSTPLRQAASAVSALTATIFIALWFVQQRKESVSESHFPTDAEAAQPALWISLAAAGGILLIAVLFWPSAWNSPWQVTHSTLPTPSDPLIFGGAVELIEANARVASPPVENEVRIETAWTRVGPMDGNTQLALSIVDESGFTWSNKEGARPAGFEAPPYATFLWPEGALVTDSQLVGLLPGTPAGHYTIEATLFNPDTFQVLRVPLNSGGSSASAAIGKISIAWPDDPVPTERLLIQYPQSQSYDGLTLLGYNLDREEVIPGERVLLTLFWEAEHELATLPPISITQSDGTMLQAVSTRPSGSIPAGARWREQTQITLPREAEPGSTLLNIAVNGAEPTSLRPITVVPVSKVWTAPAVEISVDEVYADQIRLIGLTTQAGQQKFTVELVWQSEANLTGDCLVFVHALDADGKLLAQSDSTPVSGARPTYTWLPDEFIVDPHILTVDPAAVAALRIGLYDRETTLPLSVEETNTYLVISLAD